METLLEDSWKWRLVITGPQDGDTEEDAQVYPMAPGNRPSVGGDSQSCNDGIVSSKKGSTGGLGLNNWGVECKLIRAYPVVAGGVVLVG